MNKDLLTEKLQNERIIFMDGEFNEENCQMLAKRLLYLYNQNQNMAITLYIDSYGGDVCSFLQILNLIESFTCEVHTIAMGKAMSAGAYLLLCGTPGKRYAYEHTQIMLHELSCGQNYKKLHDQEVTHEYSKKLMRVMYNIVLRKTRVKGVKDYLKENRYMSAKEAKRLDIIDEIIMRPE